ncbi:hypothetical protein ABZ791_09040 [Streptomyces huasconensis]|uniref:CHAD domain-containing protein n=1 Tax=Streptomyces huasconensis TaxID=1854574 RepID=A0ABV3M4C8_9ACTN
MEDSSAREAARERAAEVRALTHRLESLYALQYAGDRTTRLAARVARLEALLAALQGFPDAMADAARRTCTCTCRHG